MDISNIIAPTAQSQAGQANSKAESGELGKDGFLQLLVAQMKNQDPINPMDGKEFASQLAQFNSVEQLINLNDGVASLAQSQQVMSQGLSNTMAASLTGKSVQAITDKINVGTGAENPVQFKLNNSASSATITITDAAGNTVRTEELENLSSGEHTWNWDGLSGAGNRVPEGTYSVQVAARNGESEVGALTYQQGSAEKVRYTDEGVKLVVNGVEIPLGDVEEIGV